MLPNRHMCIDKLLPQLYEGRTEDQLTGFASLKDLTNSRKNGRCINRITDTAIIARLWQSFCGE